MLANVAPPGSGEEPKYTRSVFEAILAPMGWDKPSECEYELSDDGARVKQVNSAGALAWHPWCEAVKPGSPNPLDEPWLPFPFTARQLAALLVDGWGYFIQERYGDLEDGPDEDELLSIGPLGVKAKEALRAAYDAYRHAASMAPPRDHSLEPTARELAQRYRDAREAAMENEELRKHRHSDSEYSVRLAKVNATVADLGQELKLAQLSADRAHAAWRRAVVQHLLLPIDEVSAECFGSPNLEALSPEQRGGAPRRAEAEIDHSVLATREDLLQAFGNLGLKATWFDDLASHRWLMAARKVKGQGQRGRRREPLFCPYEVMIGLTEKSRRSQLSTVAGWRILEHKFPAAWAAVSVGDPR